MDLTTEQVAAVKNGEAVRLPVRAIGVECVVIRADVFDRLHNLLLEEPSAEEMRAQLAESGRRAGWFEPEMDAYDNYDENHAKQAR